MSKTDRIEKQVRLRAPQPRVWRAITDSQEFGTWFQAKVDGPFVAGTSVGGRSTYPEPEDARFIFAVETIEPETLFSFRWGPPEADPSNGAQDPSRLVEFRLETIDGGTMLTIVESGFDTVALERRAETYSGNVEGWNIQAENIRQHVGG